MWGHVCRLTSQCDLRMKSINEIEQFTLVHNWYDRFPHCKYLPSGGCVDYCLPNIKVNVEHLWTLILYRTSCPTLRVIFIYWYRGFRATKGYLHFGRFEKIGIKDLLLHCAHTDSRTVFLVVFNCRTFASMGIITSRFLVF